VQFITNEVVECLGIKISQTTTHLPIFEDNQGAIALANAPQMTPYTMHIGLKYHFFHEHVAQGSSQKLV